MVLVTHLAMKFRLRLFIPGLKSFIEVMVGVDGAGGPVMAKL